jgi:hypothetical protein
MTDELSQKQLDELIGQGGRVKSAPKKPSAKVPTPKPAPDPTLMLAKSITDTMQVMHKEQLAQSEVAVESGKNVALATGQMIAELTEALKDKPEPEEQTKPTYVFSVKRDNQGLITTITAKPV